uniref:Uncharacterized protein n=1 Tax=Oryza barthii TaxID=65489 RepID=A0A0D3HH54_9ORYZ
MGVRIHTSRGLVLDDGDLVDDDHLLEHDEQLHVHYLLGHVSHKLLDTLLLYSTHATTTPPPAGTMTVAPSTPNAPRAMVAPDAPPTREGLRKN